jgi:hypothetical protein
VHAPGATTPEINNLTLLVNIPNPSFISATPESIIPAMVQITCATHNFSMNDDYIGKMNAAGEGHLIYYLDSVPPTAAGQSANVSMGSGMMSATTNNFQEWDQLGAGVHTFYVQIVNNDNTPLNPPVVAWFKIEIPKQI